MFEHDRLLPQDQALLDRCYDLLGSGSLTIAQLVESLDGEFDYLAADGFDPSDAAVIAHYLADLLMEFDHFWQSDFLDDNIAVESRMVARGDLLVATRVFTTRILALDIERGDLELSGNLGPIADALIPDQEITINGSPGEETFDSELGRIALVGADGWLDAFVAGDVVAVRLQGRNIQVVAIAADELADGKREAAAIADYGESIDDGYGFELFEPLHNQLIRDAEAYASPVKPIDELMAERGFEQRGDWFGRMGTEWEPPGVAREQMLRESIRERFQFDDCCDDALDVVNDAYLGFLALAAHSNDLATADSALPETDIDYRGVAAALAHGRVADGLHELGEYRAGDPSYIEFLQTVAATKRTDSAAAHYAIGLALESVSQALDAERAYHAAIAADARYQSPHWPLAWIAFDRSAFGDTRRHLLALGYPPDHEIFELIPEEPEVLFEGVGRNDPCPCGSGRKFKACHQRSGAEAAPTWPLIAQKVYRFMELHLESSPLLGLALEAAGTDTNRIADLLADTFIIDLAVLEGQGLAEFLEGRGELIPASEQELALQVAGTKLDLYEATGVVPGSELTLRSVTAGSTVTVTERSASKTIAEGELLLLRVLAGAGENTIYSNVIPVPLRGRDSLIEALDASGHGLEDDGAALAAWYGLVTGPPTITTREGEKLELCTCTVVASGTDVADVEDLLARFAERSDDDPPGEWREMHQLPDGQGVPSERILRANLTVRQAGDDVLVGVTTMSLPRLDRVLDRFDEAFEIGVQDLSVQDPAATAGGDTEFDSDLSELPDDALEDLDEYIRAYEASWIDLPLPVLDGATPRQAAADPTRRDDLMRLLDSFPEPTDVDADPGMMNPVRLRQALGLN